MLSLYKKENDNLRQQNSKLLKDIEELNEKISREKEEGNVKEIQRNDILNQLLKENKAELEKKNNTINKLYNVLADVSHFMDKIKVKNFMFTFDGNNFNNLENISESTRKKLELDKENAFFSKEIATIYKEVPVDYALEDLLYTAWKGIKSIY